MSVKDIARSLVGKRVSLHGWLGPWTITATWPVDTTDSRAIDLLLDNGKHAYADSNGVPVLGWQFVQE